ncbi:MAG: asparagine synthase (glutamine-hydrolyzing) [Flavobacteriales bacterium]
MCGIAGIWDFQQRVSLNTLQRFTDSLSHRGPDGAGYELLYEGSLGLGHRRLSILDLSELGKQPVSYAGQRYWLTYNGEVFNFSDIKRELETKGHVFRSSSDSEVVLAAYAEWGAECLEKFNGMWAIAIWDDREKSLFMARDRFGIKPLYYMLQPGRQFAFASETRSFKFLDGFERSVNAHMVDLCTDNEYALEGIGYTIFDHIYQLLPGHYMIVRAGTMQIQQKRWWDIREQHVETKDTLGDQAQAFYSLFRDACKIRLQSDVPLATALSGGLDSTSVYSTVSDLLRTESLERVNANSQRAYTAVFPGLKVDELEYATIAAAFVGSKTHQIQVEPEALIERLEYETQMGDYLGRPISSISAVYRGMKSDGISVSMDGHGVDEMLYGYRNMVYGLYNHSLYTRGMNPQPYADVLLNMYYSNDRDSVKSRFEKELQQKQRSERQWNYKVKAILKSVLKGNGYGGDEFVPVHLPELSDRPYRFEDYPYPERMLYFEFFQNTLPALLRNFDRAGMMNSVEIRMPFMDYRLVKMVFGLPQASKIGQGFTKLVLREAMRGKMDESLRTRTYKVGISSPMETWFNRYLKDWALSHTQGEVKHSLEHAYKHNTLSAAIVNQAWKQINAKLIA